MEKNCPFTFRYVPNVEVVAGVRQISSNPGFVLFVPVCDDLGNVQPSIVDECNRSHQPFMFHPGTISDLIHRIHNGGRLGEASVRDRENEAGEDRKFAKQNKSLQENM